MKRNAIRLLTRSAMGALLIFPLLLHGCHRVIRDGGPPPSASAPVAQSQDAPPPIRRVTREYMAWVLQRFEQFDFMLSVSGRIADHAANNGKLIDFYMPYREALDPSENYNDRVKMFVFCQDMHEDYEAKRKQIFASRPTTDNFRVTTPDILLMGSQYVEVLRQFVQKAYDYDFSTLQPSFDLWNLGFDPEKWYYPGAVPRWDLPGAVDEFLSLTQNYTHLNLILAIEPDYRALGGTWENTYWESTSLDLLTRSDNLAQGDNAKFMELFNILEPFTTAAKNYCHWQ